MNLDYHTILKTDPLLQPYAAQIAKRTRNLDAALQRLLPEEGSLLSDVANGHLYYGLHKTKGGWVYREWAPGARAVWLFGDFNGWNRSQYAMKSLGDGSWELALPARALHHGDKLRILVDTGSEQLERIPLYIRRVLQNPDTLSFDGVVWQPRQAYGWRHTAFSLPEEGPLLIYECHVGMSGENKGIASFADFTDNVLPRVAALGYNAVQLMAVMEHPYYGSFGYQVSNFFAVSSRFGTPDDLKRLVDTAHGMGLGVILDVVHSHAARNEVEGIGRFDGTEYQFFHAGNRGNHPVWGTKLFDYGSPGVQHFLLSNLKYWLEEYHLDGLRFDGVTSMLYRDHGIGVNFTRYDQYFSDNLDEEALVYLQLATLLARQVKPGCLLIAEDVSGLPGLCRPVEEGGVGFGYRLAMGEPELWLRTLKARDEEWQMGEIWKELTTRRPGEKQIGYVESHDQALVGDKTLMFRLADDAMYNDMDKGSENLVIERAVALHKLIRLATLALGGEGYLTFMGNEFGHPDWIDFPREGNSYSYAHAQRLWSLADNPLLRYGDLLAFERAMAALAADPSVQREPPRLLMLDENAKTLVFAKGPYMFLFNFHPTRDCTFCMARNGLGDWGLVLNSDWEVFGGFRADGQDTQNRADDQVNIWLDRRSAAVYKTGLV